MRDVLDRLAESRRILAVRLDNTGDVVMLGPALRALAEALPGARLTLMASPAGSRAAPLLPWIDDVLVHRAAWQDASGRLPQSPRRERAMVDRLRRGRFDAAFVFTSFSQTPFAPAFACYLAGIPVRVGQSRDFGGSLLSHQVPPPPEDHHQAERNLWLLEAVGVPVHLRDLQLVVPSAARAGAEAVLARVGILPGDRFAVLAPAASCSARTYPPVRSGRVARMLAERTGLPVVMVASPRDRGVVDAVAAEAGPALRSLAGRTGVPELAEVVRRASLVIANNSLALHLADAFRVPQVVLYSGTDLETQWEPRADRARVLRRPTGCSPCYGLECPFRLECLDIPPEEVVDAALSLVADGAVPRREAAAGGAR